MNQAVDPQLDTSPQSMNINPPPSLRIIRAKDLGSKLKDDALYAKLITVGEGFLHPVLAERTKYWFVVPVPQLQIRIFAIRDGDFHTTDVTHEYYLQNKHHIDVHYYEHHTMFSITLTTKARSLLFVWCNEEHFYTDLFFVKEVTHNIPMNDILPPIYNYFGIAPPLVANNNDNEATDQPMQDVAEMMTDTEIAALIDQAQGPNNNRTPEPYHTLTLFDENSSTDARDDYQSGIDIENNTNVPRDYHMSDINFPTTYPRSITSNTNINNGDQYGSEDNNNTNRVENSTKDDQVPSKDQIKRNIRIVTIRATELARKWTWEAYVIEHPNIRYDELYMRGGQACNSVIVQCKQKMYEDYPNDEIHFILQVRSRRKDPLKLRGQKFLNAVMFSWWLRQPESAAKDDDDKPDPSTVTDHPVAQHRARPVHVTDDNTVMIMVFELEYPESYDQNCWVVQVCDDDKQLAIELRTKHYNLDERAQLIAEMKRRVRARLGRLFGGTNIEFKVDTWHKKPDKLRAWAYWWLGAATNRAVNFANWAGKVINYFTFGNNNNKY